MNNNDETLKPLEYSINSNHNTNIDTYSGIRLSGDFFAYGEKTVSVKIENNVVGSSVHMRGYSKGFYITITTIDDSALYMDWYEPVRYAILQKVLHYFNVARINGLKSAEETAYDLEYLVEISADSIEYS